MLQREHELKMSLSSRGSALPSVEKTPRQSQQRHRRQRRSAGDRGRRSGSGSGSSSRSASRDGRRSSSKSLSRQSSADRSRNSNGRGKGNGPRSDRAAKPKAAPSEPRSPPATSTKSQVSTPVSDKDRIAAPADAKKPPCWFFPTGNCAKGSRCGYAHVKMSEAELQASKAKVLGSSYNASPRGKGRGKQSSKGGGASRVVIPRPPRRDRMKAQSLVLTL